MSINVSEVIWTINCFFVLLFVLKKLLFNPLLRVMDERQARIDAGEAARQETEDRLRKNEAAIEESRQNCGEEAKNLLARGKADDEARHGKALAEAHAAAREAEQKMRETLRKERDEALVQAEKELPELADDLARRLLGSTAKSGK